MEDAEKRVAREAIVAGYLPGGRIAGNILGEPSLAGKDPRRRPQTPYGCALFIGGKVDHIPHDLCRLP
jgi:hypothetical protein